MNIISLIISIAFLFNTTLYACPLTQETILRIPSSFQSPGNRIKIYAEKDSYDVNQMVSPDLRGLLLEIIIQEKCIEIENEVWGREDATASMGDMVDVFWAMDVQKFSKTAALYALRLSGGSFEKAVELMARLLNEIEIVDYGGRDEHWYNGVICLHNDKIIKKLSNTGEIASDHDRRYKYEAYKSKKYYFYSVDITWEKIKTLLNEKRPAISNKREAFNFSSPIAPARYLLEEFGIDAKKAAMCESLWKFDLFSFNPLGAKLLCYGGYPLMLWINRGNKTEEIDLVSGLGDEFFKKSELYADLIGKRMIGRCLFAMFDLENKKTINFYWRKKVPYLSSIFPAESVYTKELIDTVKRLNIQKTSRVLDLGCGSGEIAVSLTQDKGCIVDAVDINPYAVACTKAYAACLGLENKINAWQSDGLSEVRGEYDYIIFNAPHFRKENLNNDIAYDDMHGKLLESVFASLKKKLKVNGCLYLMINPEAPVYGLTYGYGLEVETNKNLRDIGAVIYRVYNDSAEWLPAREAEEQRIYDICL